MADSPKMTVEENFRASLKDVLGIIEKLSPICQSTSDLAGMVQLALENDAQLRLLIKEVLQKSR